MIIETVDYTEHCKQRLTSILEFCEFIAEEMELCEVTNDEFGYLLQSEYLEWEWSQAVFYRREYENATRIENERG